MTNDTPRTAMRVLIEHDDRINALVAQMKALEVALQAQIHDARDAMSAHVLRLEVQIDALQRRVTELEQWREQMTGDHK